MQPHEGVLWAILVICEYSRPDNWECYDLEIKSAIFESTYRLRSQTPLFLVKFTTNITRCIFSTNFHLRRARSNSLAHQPHRYLMTIITVLRSPSGSHGLGGDHVYIYCPFHLIFVFSCANHLLRAKQQRVCSTTPVISLPSSSAPLFYFSSLIHNSFHPRI